LFPLKLVDLLLLLQLFEILLQSVILLGARRPSREKQIRGQKNNHRT
jgi:hypothetical protein